MFRAVPESLRGAPTQLHLSSGSGSDHWQGQVLRQPWFYDWAFNLERGPEIRAKWELIPKNTDVLITHGPPIGIADLTSRGEQVGCQDLLEVIEKIRPAIHIFGHIHEGYGMITKGKTTFINASNCDQHYQLVNPPIENELKV